MNHIGHDSITHAAAAIAAGSPLMGIPHLDLAGFVSADADIDISRWPIATDFELLIPIEHKLDRPTRCLGDLSRCNPPVTRRKFAPKSSANVLTNYFNILGPHFERPRESIVGPGDVLC